MIILRDQLYFSLENTYFRFIKMWMKPELIEQSQTESLPDSYFDSVLQGRQENVSNDATLQIPVNFKQQALLTNPDLGQSAIVTGEALEAPFTCPVRVTKNNREINGRFVIQPPSNFRKSNFFTFTFMLSDVNENPVVVEKCKFSRYSDNIENNGIIYSCNLRFGDGIRSEQDIFVKMVNSASEELIRFEPSSNASRLSPELQKVLVVHKTICSRCNEGKTCGSEIENPSDPVINDGGISVTVYMKCTQNCMKGPGKTRHPRRFKLVISTTDTLTSSLCMSQVLFIHNNSKHTKTKSFVKTVSDHRHLMDPKNYPRIIAISPSEGWTMGGQTIMVIGDNFQPGLQVIFGSIPVTSQLISSHAVRVQSPARPEAGSVEVTLALDWHQYNVETPGHFTYNSPSDPGLDQGFSRLARLVPRFLEDPPRLTREVVLSRAADILEMQSNVESQGTKIVRDSAQASIIKEENKDETLLASWML